MQSNKKEMYKEGKGNRQQHEDCNMTLTERITAVLQQRRIMQERREKEEKRERLIDQITQLQQQKTGTPT
jgi:hypothetical protein